MAEATGHNCSFRRILVVELSRFVPESEELGEQLARLAGMGVAVESLTGSAEKESQP